jgi:hypothetical protein
MFNREAVLDINNHMFDVTIYLRGDVEDGNVRKYLDG